MDFGVFMFPTHDAIDPASLGRAVEERGLESLFFPEHTHIPASRETPYPGGGDIPEMYLHTYDPFVALSVVATATQRLQVGTGICLVIERDPITLAKEVASLDHLSGGRFLFGVGAGWNREEMANHGTDPRTRMARMAESVHAMREIWTEDQATYHGRFVDFERIWSWPKPLQRPGPPVLVGGMGRSVLDRVLDFGDEWLPQNVTLDRMERFAQRAAELQGQAAEAGRGPVPMTMFAVEADLATIDGYQQAGVTRCLFPLPSAGPDQVLPLLDGYAELAGRAAR